MPHPYKRGEYVDIPIAQLFTKQAYLRGATSLHEVHIEAEPVTYIRILNIEWLL